MKDASSNKYSRVERLGVLLILIMGVGLFADGLWLFGKAEVGQMLLSRAWAKTLEDGKDHKPWPWADHWPVARLISKEHHIDQVVLAGDAGSVLAFAPGMNLQAAKPGQTGTVIISGHRDTHFHFLQNIKPGSELTLQTQSGTYSYRIEETRIVDSRTTKIDPTLGRDQLVLVTCYPFDTLEIGGTMRYVVVGQKIN